MNIQDLTLEQLSVIIVFILGLIVGIRQLKKEIKDAIAESLKDEFDKVTGKLEDLQESINDIDVQVTKNFLVRYLADVEREDVIFDAEKQRFWEEYDHYIDDLGENSFIKEWVKDLQKSGKLQNRPTPKEE